MANPKFSIGDIIHHNRFDYRGVIVDVDPEYSGSEEWYEQVAQSRPPKDAPWYHVLVHEADHTTYVAEQNMEPYNGDTYIDHPLLPSFFDGFKNGVYRPRARN